ncbi:putative zinc finger motif, C2HC5-type-domain-containing protein [Biscogniauxia marginata]|nr:putative zinc finger motif, C2HC5-type-domain-containing protein [Biscogniauxia marginata]
MSTHQLSRLLPLPDEELKQVLDYAATLSKSEVVDHFRNLLGDSPEAVNFISSFNSKRQDPKAATSSDVDAIPEPKRASGKKKLASLHTPAPRRVVDVGLAPGITYNKKDVQGDYISRRSSPVAGASRGVSPAKPSAQKSATPRPPPSAAGQLISDLPKPKPRPTPSSRSSTPGPKTKVNISGGAAMHGASTALSDLDHAIRALEITTNPTHLSDDATRRCNCVAARHPLQTAAPNCLNCGKVICVKEGLSPCTFCGTPLLSSNEVQSMIRELRAEKGREKMAIDRVTHKKAEVSKTPAPFSQPRESVSAEEAKALKHRDRLLGFQAQNAQRTTVKDEAADFDVTGAIARTGGNIWASPEERCRELKRQQKILREMEWNARPDYEKRRQVVSIDLVGGKVMRKMATIERPASIEDDEELPVGSHSVLAETSGNRFGASGGTFSKNPLLGGLIKPVFDAKGKGMPLEGRTAGTTWWRRVQDDLDDNEAIILDGSLYGRVAFQDHGSVEDEPVYGY